MNTLPTKKDLQTERDRYRAALLKIMREPPSPSHSPRAIAREALGLELGYGDNITNQRRYPG